MLPIDSHKLTSQVQRENKLRDRNINFYYKINEKIGQGGMGQVSKAVCRKTGREVAVKVLKKTSH